MKSSGIGGQAVMEGIMMRNGENYAVGVRKSNGEIVVKKDTYRGVTAKCKLFRLPFIRGIFNMIDSLALGMKSLTFSADQFAEEEIEEEPSRFEKWLEEKFGDKLEKAIMDVTMVISVILAVLIFMVLPTVISGWVRPVLGNGFLMALFEGILRLAIFIAYVALISLMKDIRRTYMYHGAEHKCINCIEQGLDLTVENVMKCSKEHKRCGTSFMLIVMTISILFFLVIRPENIWIKILTRIVLIPVIAGVSYEFLRAAGNSSSKLMDVLSRPGLMLQGLTTKEPTDDMVEVAIQAVEAVFDWKAYQAENFPEKK
ncbi:MAG: DUF1385 domain-containing protein [Lachnospiraceae bacterium]|nr:DUF1385 domain-containing protein [Lachnospiraceae bacterium]